ncbi:helix-turn-helix domain-containing protein [Mesorhizobium sp. B2-4-6]|uniref:helix-turn-helix domain-containing protein n=1 Tax=Mesorhizobium sp. B2-4-6 TaxID=2589943 RepID=UPI00112E0E6B|nr:helix-turn-helix domain-containing protein [Mesorhizobium sp. B2-4-6]TPL40637.1 hypothetical protein FJ957_25745 [Mesorhizobium sp. B2-4-6]
MHFRPPPFDRYPGIPMARRTMARDLIERVAAWHFLTVTHLAGSSKRDRVIEARYDAISAVYLNCRIGGRTMTLAEIGRLFGGRDHSTIWAALKKRGLR